MDFVHLHVHTEYSLLDGACRIGRLLDAAKEKGQKAMAITDHGVMYGVVEFYKQAQKRGIKPIIGCEVYVAPRTRFDKVKGQDSEYTHLVLLCETQQGYRNLCQLVSKSFIEGFYTKPRIDKALLEEYHEGLIGLSACLAGEIPRKIVRGDLEGATRSALYYRDLFGEGNFFLEVQDHGLTDQQTVNKGILEIAERTGIPLVATNDVHYIEKEDHNMQKVLICIGTNHTIEEENPLAFETESFYLKSADEMEMLFGGMRGAIENTVQIAERCNVEFEFGKIKLPRFDIGSQDHFTYFKDLCYKGLRERYGERPDAAVWERLDYELKTINQMGYVDYYLIVADFVNFAKSKGIPVGPGRGSGAGSLAAYCIGITGIDPIKYNLLFERFLNPERVSMPDFDIDFCYVRRGEVIDYVVNKYGTDHVAQIVTFGTMAARAAVRDVGRALGIPYATCDKVAKQIPFALNMTIDKAVAESPELRQSIADDPQIAELIDMARKVEGMPRHASKHAAGVVITDRPVVDYVPLATSDEDVVTQFPMTTLDELGLLKMDFLGLRNLTVIADTEKMIRQEIPDFEIEKAPLDDADTFRMMAAGQTEGVFQFESGGMRNVLHQMRPDSMEDLIAIISLYRPGPMDSIPTYVHNRHHPQDIQYLTPLLKPILEVTYGCIVYQEQVMQIFRSLAGYSLGRADIVRRAMSKKKHDVMARERQAFIYGEKDLDGNVSCEGAVNRGVSEDAARRIFDQISAFSSYAFNKSHAAAYAFVAYWTAYLKCHYKREYMAALLTSVLDSTDKVVKYIAECGRMGIEVLPPDVNESQQGFSVSGKAIRFGLLAVKNLGQGLIRQLLEARKEGAFSSLFDFCDRLYGKDLNRRALESLIKCGALDSLADNRRQMLEASDSILTAIEAQRRQTQGGQMGLFDLLGETPQQAQDFKLPQVEEMSRELLLAGEKETTGLYLSGHPMQAYAPLAKQMGAARIIDLLDGGDEWDGKRVTLLAQIATSRLKSTKQDQTMAFLSIEDMYGTIRVLVFPKTYADNAARLLPGAVLKFTGRVSIREEQAPELVLESAEPVATAGSAQPGGKSVKPGLYLRVASQEDPAYLQVEKTLSLFDGGTPLYLKDLQSGKFLLAPREKWVAPNESMLRECERLLGAENVRYIPVS